MSVARLCCWHWLGCFGGNEGVMSVVAVATVVPGSTVVTIVPVVAVATVVPVVAVTVVKSWEEKSLIPLGLANFQKLPSNCIALP